MQQYEGAIVRDPQGRRHKIVNGVPVPLNDAPEAAPGFQQIVAPRVDPIAAARLDLAQQEAARSAAREPSPQEEALKLRLLEAQVQSAQAQAAKARQGTAGANQGDVKSQQRNANIGALEQQLGRVRSLYEQNLRGGVPNWIAGNVPDAFRPENGQFESAAAGLGEIGMAAFRVPGVGSQSDAELKNFINANTPQPGDSDAKIEEKLNTLSTRLRATQEAQGVTAAPQAASQRAFNPAMAPATNGYREVPDAGASAMIDKLVRAGVPFARARNEFRKAFPGANPFEPKDYNAAVAYARKNPDYKGSFGAAVKSEPLNSVESAINSVGNNGLGAYGVAAANALTAGTLDELSGNQERGQFTKDMLRRQNPGASLGGDVTGSALGMVGLNAGLRFAGGRLSGLATKAGGLGGDALYGAALGAGENNDNRLMGALTGAGAATAGNLAGRGLVSGAGRVARGVQNPNVGYLTERGVPLTPGQVMGQGGMFGRAVRGIEDKLTSVPLLGDAISSRRAEGLAAFNREAFNDALKPIGQQIEGNLGQNAIGQAQDLVSNAYGDALNGVRLRADLPFVQQVAPAIRSGRANPKTGADFGQVIDGEIAPLFGPGRSLDGSGFQEAAQAAQRGASWFAKEGSPSSNAAAGNLRDVRESLMDLANRQAPGTTEGLANANGAYRNLSILEDASLAALNGGEGAGVFTAAQLGNAMKANGKKFGGKKAAARGDMPFSELQEAGQALLPSTVPNSGTVDRAYGSLLLPGALGGAAYGADQLEAPMPVVASLAALAALSSKPGSAAFQRMAVNRPESLGRFGDQLMTKRARRVGGMFGGSLLLPFVGP